MLITHSAIMPRSKKETQADIQQRTMEKMQTKIVQLTQAMQGLLAQQNTATREKDEEEQSDHEDDANPFAVLRGNWPTAQPVQLNERWIGVSSSRFQNFMEPK